MSKKTEMMRTREAYHEAGHTVMNLLLMLPFEGVSLRTIEKSMFEYKNGQKVPVKQIITEGLIWSEERKDSVNKNICAGMLDLREALSSMSGPEAEAIFIGKIDDIAISGAKNDMLMIAGSCRAAISPDIQIQDCPASVMEDAMCQAIGLQARELLKKNWVNVEKIAEALLKHRYLSYEKAKSLMKTLD